MAKSLKIMCVHGLGDHRQSDWQIAWPKAVRSAIPGALDLELEFVFVTYDDIFEKVKLSPWETAAAAAKLLASGVTSAFSRQKGFLGDISEKVRWTAGYVVAWVEDDSFKAKSRKRILDALAEHQPDVVVAHSLGTLVTYNAFTHTDAKAPAIASILARATYVTFGSQINNPFVIKNTTNGRVQEVAVRFWHHLYNKHDDIFTAPILNWNAPNFRQTDTPFDLEGVGDHDATGYLGHRNTSNNVWSPLAVAMVGGRSFGPPTQVSAATTTAIAKGKAPPKPHKVKRRALLVGINDYPDPSNRLEGCINDVFTMSSVLQECGFQPEEIRTCLDSRATAEGILDRLGWLLDGAGPGDELVFYYSGHGARIPEYGDNFEPDRHMETLVPWDFDWTPGRAISDDQIWQLYSQLSYDTRFVMIFDCCHSGGIHRDGGARARGITPPDDIRHRELKWDSKTQMWVQRDFTRINKDFAPKKEAALADRYFGKNGTTERLGRASMVRGLTSAQYQAVKASAPESALGPYLPLIIEACGEEQLSYEYRHGAISHGAFTFSLANILRRRKSLTFEALVEQTRAQLEDLKYDQKPQILGPMEILGAKVPWVSE